LAVGRALAGRFEILFVQQRACVFSAVAEAIHQQKVKDLVSPVNG
jgi:hypothetical protein